MTSYPVYCLAPGCHRLAVFKIAARWSDGQTGELKTYGLACEQCLLRLLAEARLRQARCRLAVGESMEPVGVYELCKGSRDRALTRRVDLESSPNLDAS